MVKGGRFPAVDHDRRRRTASACTAGLVPCVVWQLWHLVRLVACCTLNCCCPSVLLLAVAVCAGAGGSWCMESLFSSWWQELVVKALRLVRYLLLTYLPSDM